jgi:hypothetical protein
MLILADGRLSTYSVEQLDVLVAQYAASVKRKEAR